MLKLHPLLLELIVNDFLRPALTAEEREARAEGVRYALASVGLEGFAPGPAWEALAARYVAGELSIEQMVTAVKALDV